MSTNISIASGATAPRTSTPVSTRSPSEVPPVARKRVYEIAVAALAVAIFHGVVTADEGQLWLAVLVPVLGLARVNVSEDK